MRDLLEIRDEIDRVDAQIVSLYEKRMQLALEVAAYKLSTGKKVYDKEREREKLEAVAGMVADDIYKNGVQELFEHIMSISRKRQYQLLAARGTDLQEAFSKVDSIANGECRVVYQGVEGAYAHIAVRKYFGEDAACFHVDSWRDAMEEIRSGRADFAVLPIENSTAGVVAEIFDLLVEYDHYIVAEQIIPVSHCLLGLPGAKVSDIRQVHSHPQALAQCGKYLQANPAWECVKESNTAVAAKMVRDTGDMFRAAIASELTAELYGLDILEQGIQESRDNSTRFLVISKQKIYAAGASKVSICIELKHESGSLYHALSHILYNNLNMDFIQSRPLRGKEGANWQYRFFIDFEGDLEQSAVQNALLGLEAECERMRVLGNY